MSKPMFVMRCARIVPGIVCLSALVLACGPGGFASDGGFGDDGSDSDTDDEIGTTDSEPPDPSTDDGLETSTDDGETSTDSETETETETETGADDWTDPDTETDTDDPPPNPIDPECARVWTHLDTKESHGHIGATPMGPRPDGGFISVNPVVASADGVNVDSWIRSWSPAGEIDWDQQISWDIQRDDPLAVATDEIGDVFLAGRINANTFEDAMVAKLDGASGEVVWTYLQGESGGLSSIVHNGAVVVAAGSIGSFGDRRLVVLAFDPDTGELVWSAEALHFANPLVRGLVVADGFVDVLFSQTIDGFWQVSIMRFDPPGTEATYLAELGSANVMIEPRDLELYGGDRLAALYDGAPSTLTIVDHQTGAILESIDIASYALGSMVSATELVELPAPNPGLAFAGTNLEGNIGESFVVRLDEQFEIACTGRLGEGDLGVFQTPLLRGLEVALDGTLTTASYVDNPTRLGAFARWE